MKVVYLFLLLLCVAQCDDLKKTFQEIVQDYGYPFEQHIVTTSDGYMLKLFRIKHGKDASNPNEVGQPILIQHGIFDSADFVVAHGDTDSPAFWLANRGYDVWVANSRGNKYSRQHKHLNPDKDNAFWDFSFVDMVEDYKANIEHVLSETKHKKIPLIGHSQGTSSAWTGLAQDPDWFSKRVTLFVGLGSVARLDHMHSKLLQLLCKSPIALNIIKKLGIVEMFPSDFLTKTTFKILCGTIPEICQFGAAIIADRDPNVDSSEWARIYFAHFPSGTSTKALEHYSQIYNSKKFQYFDYGKDGNQERYGSDSPPDIPLDKIDIPIAKFTGDTDALGDLDDNNWLSRELKKNLVFDRTYRYGHLSFFIAKNMGYLDDLLEVLQDHPAQMAEIKDLIKESE